jgi:murein L,D-transpeptidase YcbB/YkuD
MSIIQLSLKWKRMLKINKYYIKILFVALFLLTSSIDAKINIAFQEVASTVMMNSLQTQPKKSFLRKLYAQVFFVPIWMREESLSPAAKDLFAHIKNDDTLDKQGKLYQDTLRLEEHTRNTYVQHGTLREKVSIEFKISQLYEAYTNYSYLGSINWGAFNARISNLMVNDVSTEWVLHRPEVNALAMAENAALGGSLAVALENAVPDKYHYKALQVKLSKYRNIKAEGGWGKVPIRGILKAGNIRKAVPLLRERLRITGDYTSCEDKRESNVYDKCLQKAVKSFQARHGLNTDGAVGKGTLRVLNQTVETRITTMLLNLDRIKWLKKRTEKRRVIINIPDFTLHFEEDGKLRQSIRTVVGKPKNPTPIFSNMVKTIVLNPYWNLPNSIIQKEMIPKLLKNPNAMVKEGIEIRNGWKKDAALVNPSTIDWAAYRYSKHVPFRFAQVPGNRNALGKLKFLFPNKYAVYMHDTPSKHLFKRNKRAFSHGCIRLQKPRELLKTFASFNDNIDFKKSQEILKGKKKTYFSLKKQVPVDVIYLTSWVDYEGKLQFRNDIYGYDKMQLKSFRKW